MEKNKFKEEIKKILKEMIESKEIDISMGSTPSFGRTKNVNFYFKIDGETICEKSVNI